MAKPEKVDKADPISWYGKKIKFQCNRDAIRSDIYISDYRFNSGLDQILDICNIGLVHDIEKNPDFDFEPDEKLTDIINGTLHRYRCDTDGERLEDKGIFKAGVEKYIMSLEVIVQNIDNNHEGKAKRNRLEALGKSVRDIFGHVTKPYPPEIVPVPNIPFSGTSLDPLPYLPYEGNSLKISARAYAHIPSVAILTEDPKEAITYLDNEKARTIFAEYSGNSAEMLVSKLYGTDGLYAEHYHRFLDCKKKYPAQKHLFD